MRKLYVVLLLYLIFPIFQLEAQATIPELYTWLRTPSDEKLSLGKFHGKAMSDFQLTTSRDTVNFFLMKAMAYEKYGQPEKKALILDSLAEDPSSFYSPSFCYLYGNQSFMAGNYQMAILSYSSLFNESIKMNMDRDDSLSLAKTVMMNLGSAYNRLENYDKALECYLASLDHSVSNPLLINNIASVYINLSDYESAYQLLKQAELSEALQNQTLASIQLNLLTACLHTDRMEEAEKLTRMIDFNSVQFGDTVGPVIVALRYYDRIGDTLEFLKTVEQNIDIINNKYRPSLVAAYMIYIASKMDNVIMEEVAWELWRETGVKTRIQKTKPLVPLKLLNKESKIRLITGVVILVILVGSVTYYWGRISNRNYLKSIENEVKKSITDAIMRERPKAEDNVPQPELFDNVQGPSINDPEVTMTNSGSHDEDIADRIKLFMEDLNLTEARMINYLTQGLATKEIAIELKCSVGYAYNLRSAIRKKFENFFDRQGDPSFDGWLKSKFIDEENL